MIVGSLVLILSAAGLLAGGLILSSDWLLGGSTVASLFAAVLLYLGARQGVAARRRERAALDDEGWDDEPERHSWPGPGHSPGRDADPEFEHSGEDARPIERRPAEDVRSEFERRIDHDVRSGFDAVPDQPAAAAVGFQAEDQASTERAPRMYSNTRAGFGRYASDSKGSLLDREEPLGADDSGIGAPADSGFGGAAAGESFGRRSRDSDRGLDGSAFDEPTLDAPRDSERPSQPDQWRTRPLSPPDSGDPPYAETGGSHSLPPHAAEPVGSDDLGPLGGLPAAGGAHAADTAAMPARAPDLPSHTADLGAAPDDIGGVAHRAPPPPPPPPPYPADDEEQWVGGGLDDEDPKDEPPIQRRAARVAAAVARIEADVFVIDGRPRYHVPGCVHLLGRDSEPLPAAEAVDLGFTPCGLCEPDTALTSDTADNARQ